MRAVIIPNDLSGSNFILHRYLVFPHELNI